MIRGALLDIDGTLLDSNDAHAASFADALAEQGRQVSPTQLKSLIGMGGDNLLPALGIDPSSKVGKTVSRRKQEIFGARYLPRLHPFPATRDLLDHMKARGLALVVATSAKGDELQALLRATGVEDLIDAQSTSSDARKSKPAPDIVEAAIARSQLPRAELMMLGDTPYDVEAGTRAGVPVVGVLAGGWPASELFGAVAIYQDAADLLANYADSPFARR
jgi:phosphoglycolate phosphatase-like HAD superfamily hydrolase